jgi:CO/xanthine dehydrogenase FAD-binding subunit
MALNARVEVRSHSKPAAQIELFSWIISPKKTQISSDALVTALIIPKPNFSAASAFLKTGARAYLLISTVMVAALLEHKQGRITQARIAVGACSPVSKRLASLENKLIGRNLHPSLCDEVLTSDFDVLSPIEDVRANAAYRHCNRSTELHDDCANRKRHAPTFGCTTFTAPRRRIA